MLPWVNKKTLEISEVIVILSKKKKKIVILEIKWRKPWGGGENELNSRMEGQKKKKTVDMILQQ